MSVFLGAIVAWSSIPLPLPDRGEARDAAHHELSRAIYAGHRPTLLQRAYEALLRWLGHLIGKLVSVTPGGPIGLVVLGVLVIGLLVLLFRRLGPIRRSAVLDLDLGPASRTAARERVHAEELAARGSWAEAIRSRLRAVSRELEEIGVLEPRPGRTADELAREAGRARPDIAHQIRLAVEVFDEVWYGGRAGSASGYATVVAADDALRRRLVGAGS